MKGGSRDIAWFCGTAILLCAVCSLARAQQEISPSATLDWYKGRGDYLIPKIRQDIRRGLSPNDREFEEQIQYDVIPTWNANAQAIRRNGISRTGIAAGLLAVIDWVSTAMAIQAAFHKDRCSAAYIQALADAILQNSRAAGGTGAYKKFGSPWAFAYGEPQICSGVSMPVFRENKQADDLRELWITGSIEFVLAHELGHHVLGHTASNPKDYPESRRRETAADEFAFKTMAKAGMNPAFAMPLVILWSDLEGYSIEGEGDHPAGIRRLRALIEAAKQAVDSDPDAKAAIRRDGMQEQWNKIISTFEQQLSVLEQQ